MAEIVLLIVFALLIALAAVWQAEHREKLELKSKLDKLETTGSIPNANPADQVLLKKIEERLRSPTGAKIKPTLEQIATGEDVPALSEGETEFITEVRTRVRLKQPPEIDKYWRELVWASKVDSLGRKLDVADAVATMAPTEAADPNELKSLIEKGLQAKKKGEHDWPPIILHETEGYSFAKGRAELSPTFEQQLRDRIVPDLLAQIDKFHVDLIEVIGHTDEQAIALRPSNLDRLLLDTLKGSGSIAGLIHGDNAGLGLSRAASVVRALILDGRLPQTRYRILPLSGGHLIGTDEKITSGAGGDAPERRRIEIRLRRSQESLGRR